VPQSGPYADEGADELRAYELAVEHLNGGGDGGMLNTFSSKALEGNGILGKKVEFVTGDTQTKSDAARASAKSMIEKDGAIMITGGSSSGVAVAVQALCQEAGVIFMAGLTHSNDTTGKDKKANGFRHFFNSYMSGAALAPVLANAYGNRPQGLSPDRRLQLGLHHRRGRARLDRSSGLGNRRTGEDPADADRLLVLHRAGSATPAPTCWF
jgi:branched-chain amino acid transport system substrate-binding protein